MHLSPELEWAQFLVIMVVGFMLLYDCVLNRKHARKMEGIIGDDGTNAGKSREGLTSQFDPESRSIKFMGSHSQLGLSKDGMLGGPEAPVYYPTLSPNRDQHRAGNKALTDAFAAKYSAAYSRALARGLPAADAQTAAYLEAGNTAHGLSAAQSAAYAGQASSKQARSAKLAVYKAALASGKSVKQARSLAGYDADETAWEGMAADDKLGAMLY